jgi:hypothetical protein
LFKFFGCGVSSARNSFFFVHQFPPFGAGETLVKKIKPISYINSYLPQNPHTFLAQYFNTCPKGKKGQAMKKIIERTKN